MGLTKELYPFQKVAARAMYDYLMSKSKRPVLVSLPTGGGKTLVISAVAKYANKKILMIVPNKELLEQNLEEAEEQGIEGIGVYSASVKRKEFGENITIATMKSIHELGPEFKERGYDTVILDESHVGTNWRGSQFKWFMKALGPKKVIGLSGTIYRLESTMAGSKLILLNKLRPSYFKDIIHVTQTSELVSQGYWTPISYETHEFDESGLIYNSTGAEFTKKSVEEQNKVQGINNNIYKRVKKLLRDGYTSILVFCDSVSNAEIFASRIPGSAALSAETPKKERAKIIKDFKDGKINVIFNVKILTTGFNHKPLQVVIMGYPTNSMSLYEQIVGRGVRLHESKKEFLFIDYCNNVKRFGHVEEKEVINYPGHGWGLFSGDGRLISGVLLNSGFSITKETIDRKNAGLDNEPFEDYALWFGKFKGKKISWLQKNKPYMLHFILREFDDNTERIRRLKASIRKLLTDQVLK